MALAGVRDIVINTFIAAGYNAGTSETLPGNGTLFKRFMSVEKRYLTSPSEVSSMSANVGVILLNQMQLTITVHRSSVHENRVSILTTEREEDGLVEVTVVFREQEDRAQQALQQIRALTEDQLASLSEAERSHVLALQALDE